jgi:hypothetical protein
MIGILKSSDSREALIEKVVNEFCMAESLAYVGQSEFITRKLTENERNRRGKLGYHKVHCTRRRIPLENGLSEVTDSTFSNSHSYIGNASAGGASRS